MLFYIVRLLILLIAICIVIVLKKRKKIILRNKKHYFIILFILISTVNIISFYPIENFFITFNSPERAFGYYAFGEIQTIVYGEDSCFIVYLNENDIYKELIFPKSRNGYKLPSNILSKNVVKKQEPGKNMKVVHVVGSNDYYISGNTVTKDKNIKIRSSDDSEFNCISVNLETSDYKIVLFYGYTNYFPDNYDDYMIYINDKLLF